MRAATDAAAVDGDRRDAKAHRHVRIRARRATLRAEAEDTPRGERRGNDARRIRLGAVRRPDADRIDDERQLRSFGAGADLARPAVVLGVERAGENLEYLLIDRVERVGRL